MAIKSVKRGRQTAPRCRNLPLKFNVIRDFQPGFRYETRISFGECKIHTYKRTIWI